MPNKRERLRLHWLALAAVGVAAAWLAGSRFIAGRAPSDHLHFTDSPKADAPVRP